MLCNYFTAHNFYYITPKAESHSSKVLTMLSEPPGSGLYTVVLEERMDNSWNKDQMWKIESAELEKKHLTLIQNAHIDWVLDVEGGFKKEGTPVILWPKKETGYSVNQLWRYNNGMIETQLKEGMVLTYLDEIEPSSYYGMVNRLVIMNANETLSEQQLWDLVPVKKMT